MKPFVLLFYFGFVISNGRPRLRWHQAAQKHDANHPTSNFSGGLFAGDGLTTEPRGFDRHDLPLGQVNAGPATRRQRGARSRVLRRTREAGSLSWARLRPNHTTPDCKVSQHAKPVPKNPATCGKQRHPISAAASSTGKCRTSPVPAWHSERPDQTELPRLCPELR